MSMSFSRIISLYNSNSRTAIIFKNIVASFGIKGLSIIVSFILVPVTINYLSSEVYGIWLTLVSIVHWSSLFDLGLTNGLRNKLAAAISNNDFFKGKKFVSTTYFVVVFIFIVVGVIGYVVSGYINWASLLSISNTYNDEVCVAARIIIIFFSFQMVFKTIGSVALSFQNSALSGLIETVGQIISLLSVLIVIKFSTSSLPLLAFALSLSPLIGYFFFSIILYQGKYKKVAPSLQSFDKGVIKEIMGLGWQFFVIQISYIVIYQTTNVIISRVAGPESVTEYNIAYKLLNVVLMATTIIITPIWSAFTDAYTKHDVSWMSKSYKRLLRLFGVCVCVIILLVAFSGILYNIWVGDSVNVSVKTTVCTAFFILSTIWMNMHSYIMNGIGKIKLQLYLSLIGMFFNVPIALFLGHLIGLEGVILSSIIVNIPWIILAPLQVKKEIIK